MSKIKVVEALCSRCKHYNGESCGGCQEKKDVYDYIDEKRTWVCDNICRYPDIVKQTYTDPGEAQQVLERTFCRDCFLNV